VAKLNAHGENLAAPKIIAFIDVEGTSSAMLGIINTNNLDKDYSEAKVKAILRSKDKREGTLKDILYWEEV
jgi:uncharacterized OB-fold protein